MLTTTTMQHCTIGAIRGIRRPSGVTQYLGVQYATLQDRFSRGQLLDTYSSDHALKRDGALDATELGPIPLSPENGCGWEQKLIQKELPFSEYPQSDIDCLTLNIAVPPLPAGDAGLPVLALIHGGAFATGSSSYPQYDLERITKLSADIGTPIIAVGINYRLGAPGFLSSSAMIEAQYYPNNGLDDQKLGFRWIQHHIAGFGGDPGRVTCIGESAGGASAFFHLHSDEVLFHQVISMSGTSLLRPRPIELAEKSFGRVVQDLGGQNHSSIEQVRILVMAALDELRTKAGRHIPLGPMVDGEIIPRVTTYSDLKDPRATAALFPGMKHCKRIVVGDCQCDGLVFANRIAARTDILPQTLSDCLSTVLDPVDATIRPALMAAYRINASESSNTPDSTERVLWLGNDICFAAAAQAFAEAWSQSDMEALLYRFNCPNPWDGQWKGHAVHIQDIAFALLNYQQHLGVGQQECAEQFARDIIAFVHEKSPWPSYQKCGARGSQVYFAHMTGEKNESCYIPDDRAAGRRDHLQRLVPVELLDKVMDAWQMFMAGPQ